MYYGIEGAWTYATTNLRNAGNLQSPALSLDGIAAPITLSFNHLLKTEGGTAWDQATVLISTNAGATWTALISTTNLVNPLIQSASFTNLAVDLSEYAGRDIVLRFNFDTMDGDVNNFEGWYLDDVVIRAAGSQRILLIEDQTGFDGTADLLRGLDYPVTEVSNEFANGYTTLLNGSFLSRFGLVVYGERGNGTGSVLPANVAASLENYVQGGGNVLVTGYDTLGHPTDTNLAGLVRAINPGDQNSGSANWQVTNLNHVVVNGPYGDFRGQSFTATGYDDDRLTADTGRGAVTLARTPGLSDRIIFTDVDPGGSVGYWNGGLNYLAPTGTDAQPDFNDGGIPQNLFLNWVVGVLGAVPQTPTTTTQTVNAVDTGWYDSTGYHGPENANYFCGRAPSSDVSVFRDWFVFDVPVLTGVVASAELLINSYVNISPAGFENYALRQVATPISQLVAGGSSLTNIYNDLADGTLYGSRNVYTSQSYQTISVPLNAAFLSALMAASGGQIALGGSLSTLSGTPDNEFVFGMSNGNPGDVQLRITYATSVSPRVALFGADIDADWTADVKAKIVATGLFDDADVDVYSGNFATPTLSQLQQYAAVFTWSAQEYLNGTEFGNVLADYVDNGGGVVVATFAFYASSYGTGLNIEGRLLTGGYLPFTTGAQAQPGDLTLVKDLPLHPLLDGVITFNGGLSSYHNAPITIASNATLVAHWSNGQPLVGARAMAAGRVAGLNFFPPSSDVRDDFWTAGTDGGRLMANALLWAGKRNSITTVSVFDNPLYVDSSGGVGAESDNVQASLTNLGYSVVTFTNIVSGISGQSVVVIPELENGNLAADLTAPERTALQNFVQGGGTLVVHGSFQTTRTAGLNKSILGTSVMESLESVGAVYTRTPQAVGTSFAGNPASLATLDGSDYLATSSLPPGALNIYSNGTRTLVAVLPSGAGRIVFLGWDWYNAMPIGSQNGGWLQALSSAVTFFSTTIITTTNVWNGSDSITSFGEPNTATYGQTFVAPPQAILNRFTLYINNVNASVDFKFYIMGWDGAMATGPVLYESAAASTAGQSGMQPFTFYTGDLVLTPGATYVAFACASTLFDGVNSTAVMGRVIDAYAGGKFVYLNNGADFSLLTSSSWFELGSYDLAFVAAFVGIPGGGGGIAPLRFLPMHRSGGSLQLALGTTDNSPIAPERAVQVRLYSTTDLSLPFSSWLELPLPTGIVDGVLWLYGLSTTDAEQRFFRAVEPAP